MVNDNVPQVATSRDSVSVGEKSAHTPSTNSVDLSSRRDSDIAQTIRTQSGSTPNFLNNLTIQMDVDPKGGTTKGTDGGTGDAPDARDWMNEGPNKLNQTNGDGSRRDGPYSRTTDNSKRRNDGPYFRGADDGKSVNDGPYTPREGDNDIKDDVYRMNRRFNTPGADAINDIHPSERSERDKASRAETGNPSTAEEVGNLAKAAEMAKNLPASSAGSDGSRTVDLPDGKKYTSWPDGRERLEDKRTGTMTEKKDGQTTSKYWDGEKYSKAEVQSGKDGSKSYHFDNGRVATPNEKDGTYTISDDKGSETYHWNKAFGEYSGFIPPPAERVTQPMPEAPNDNSKPPKGSIRELFPELFPPDSDKFPKGKNPIGRDQAPGKRPSWTEGPQPIGRAPIGPPPNPEPIGLAPRDGSFNPQPIGLAPSDDFPGLEPLDVPPRELIPNGNHPPGGGGDNNGGREGKETKPRPSQESEIPQTTDPNDSKHPKTQNRIAPDRERRTQQIMARRYHAK